MEVLRLNPEVGEIKPNEMAERKKNRAKREDKTKENNANTLTTKTLFKKNNIFDYT